MGSFNFAGPFLFDPEREPPAINLDEWTLTDNYRDRHELTGCEFRTVQADSGGLETYLKLCDPRRMPPPEQLAELARASVLAGRILWREWCEDADCDAQNQADRLPGWVGR